MAEEAIFAAIKVLENALAGELAKLTISETSNFANIKARMDNTSSELRLMQGCLHDMDNNEETSNAQAAWVKEVQRLANHVEDLMAEFENLVGKNKFGGMSFHLKKMFKEPKALLALKRIGFELSEAEKRIKRLGEVRDRWVTRAETRITSKILKNGNNYFHNTITFSELIDEDNIVGFENIIKELSNRLNKEESEITVTSVWGTGGVGKTTLATHVFKRERNSFDLYALISISQKYTTRNILRDLIYEICKGKNSNQIGTDMDLRELKNTLSDLLKEKRYLIVLDDMWNAKAYLDIRGTLMCGHSRSHIVITTRIDEVASLTRDNNRLKVEPMSKHESWNLFCKKAFYRERNYECPPALEKFARAVVKKCDGLPLALVSLGGTLSLFEKTEFNWKCIHDQLSWQRDNNPSLSPVKNVLNLCFNYLPRYLKNCLMYCALFPEDFLYGRKNLIRLWVAEGFIEQKGRSILEQVAEEYLNELVHRNMIQVVEKNLWGRVRRCRMHDMIRSLVISRCKIDNFGSLREDNEPANIDVLTRRLSIIKLRDEIRDGADGQAKLRTFLVFDPFVHSSHMLKWVFSICKYLSVMDLCGIPIETVPPEIGNLFNLHYLGLRTTKVKFLPKSIKKLHNLQTLDLHSSKIERLPDGIAYLKKLRHLIAHVVTDKSYSSFQSHTGVTLPRGMRYLKKLQTLRTMVASAEAVKEVGYLTQLRTMKIWNVKKNHWADLCSSLSEMPFLSFLSIATSQECEFLHLEAINPPPTQLQKLGLCGQLNEETLESPLFRTSGKNVRYLVLRGSKVRFDPLPYLSHMDNLTVLSLWKAYEGHQLVFHAGWFPKLKLLSLEKMSNLVLVDIQQGTMVQLEKIEFLKLEKLAEIPRGIEHLTSLEEMFWYQIPAYVGGLSKGTHKLYHFTCYVK